MQKIKTKHVIHLNTHKGRLRKIVWGKNLLQLDDSTDLVVASEHLTEQQTNQNKPRQNFFLRKYGRKTNKEVVEANQDSEQQTGQALERGAFRAIHTACPYDSIKGFPLRSMTPVKPFRRGIRADSFKSNVLDLQKLEYDRPVTRVPRNKIGMSNTMPVRNSFPLVANELSEVLAAPPSASQNAQQFFMYSSTRIQKKESVQKDANKSPRMVAGIKIQPFRKYHIRQIQKGIYFGQNHKSHHSAM